MKKGIIVAAIAILVIGFGIFLAIKNNPGTNINTNNSSTDPYANKSSRDLALMCDTSEHVVMHIHPVLKITINGQSQVIPANIGIEGLSGETTHEQAQQQAVCLHFIHTHDATGIIHVESPIQMDYHLSDFFAVWGKTFNKDQILDNKVDDKHQIRMLVNGQANSDFENLVLKDKDQIEIIYETKS